MVAGAKVVVMEVVRNVQILEIKVEPAENIKNS